MNTNSVCIAFGLVAAIHAPGAPAAQVPATPPPASELKEPRVGVRFEGFLPGTRDEKLKGEFAVEFKIYLSPQGGDAVWNESLRVKVEGGRMDVVLGATNPIPMSLHEATFKFLGASVGGAREVYPRFTIVNTVYASTEEALRTPLMPREGTASTTTRAAASGVYADAGATLSAHTEKACTWKDALLAARAAGADLPDYQDWYRALGTCTKEMILERTGHYEWVLPWVYDTASHGDYNRLFRGRFQGCDYMDLSPTNSYVHRFAIPSKPLPSKAEASK